MTGAPTMMTDKRLKEIAESLRRLAANYTSSIAEFEDTLGVLCRKLELDEITVLRPHRSTPAVFAPAETRGSELLVDRTDFTVRWNDRSCYLGNSLPFRLLERLSRRPNQYVSSRQLLDEVWGGPRSKAAIRSVVKVLRQKLRRAGMRDLAQAIDGRTRDHYALAR
jgi:DNA-binding response OmpR family regulator